MDNMDNSHYKKKLEKMRQQHEMEKQVLMAQFQYQNSSLQQHHQLQLHEHHQLQLHEHHQLQLQEHLKLVLLKQREQRAMDLQSLHEPDDLSNEVNSKDKKKESAVASNAVKKRLQNFVIGRQKEKMDLTQSMGRAGTFRWNPLIDEIDDRHEQSSINSQYKCGDFPLRKTASEPNLKVRSRLKQKLLLDQRSSPLLPRRHDIKLDIANRIKKKLNSESVAEVRSNNLPNSTSSSPVSHDASTSSNKEDEFNNTTLRKTGGNLCAGDLYASPSLPNISMGMLKKRSDQGTFSPHEAELNRIVSRTSSFPGQLIDLSRKEYTPSLKDHPKEIKVESSLVAENLSLSNSLHKPILHEKEALSPSHGPIRPSQLSRPHKSLIRTQSAPTTATLQLQQRILQRKLNRSLKQQKDQKSMTKYLDQPPVLPIHPEHELESKEIYSRFTGSLPVGLYSSMEKAARLFDQKLDSFRRNSPQAMIVEPSLPTNLPAGDTLTEGEFVQLTNSSTKPTNSNRSNYDLQAFVHKPLQRTKSSPAFMKKLTIRQKYRHTTGIAYSPVMLKHGCACGDDHIEHAGRLRAVWNRLTDCGLVGGCSGGEAPCELIESRKATTDELQLVHTQEHTLRYGTTSLARKELDLSSKFIVLPCGGVGVDNGIDMDTVWNELDTINAARMAVGCTVDLCLLVAQNQLTNGFTLVRPPGHHAQKNLAMAFCYFNSVAVATRKVQSSGLARKVLILDWDIHHCNGTQDIFYNDPSVLVISIHRYDDGNFFPGTGALDEVGSGLGGGFNVNIGFSGGVDPAPGDADYLAVFRTLVMPMALRFNPDLVLISSGFSAATGHSTALGGYSVSPQCFGYLTRWLGQLAGGKVVMVLEGGFELTPLCDCTEACVRTLLGENESSKLSDVALTAKPCPRTVATINTVVVIQGRYWSELDGSLARISHAEWISASRENETVTAMASLSVKSQNAVLAQRSQLYQDDNLSKPCTTLLLDDGSMEAAKTLNNWEKSPTDTSISDESSPLDVVGTTPPSSPNGYEESNREQFITNDDSST